VLTNIYRVHLVEFHVINGHWRLCLLLPMTQETCVGCDQHERRMDSFRCNCQQKVNCFESPSHHINPLSYSSDVEFTAAPKTSSHRNYRGHKATILMIDLLSYAASQDTRTTMRHLVSYASSNNPFKDLRKLVGHDKLLRCQRSAYAIVRVTILTFP